jgi:hypothetical protein
MSGLVAADIPILDFFSSHGRRAHEAAAEWFFTRGPVTSDGKTYLPGLQ